MAISDDSLPLNILDLFQNTLVLRHICPYLGLEGRLALSATCNTFRTIIFTYPGCFQHVEHSSHTLIDWHYRRPRSKRNSDFTKPAIVLHYLRTKKVLQDVQTLVLDGLVVPIHVLWPVLFDDSSSIRILSLRGVYDLNDDDLLGVLRYLIRPKPPFGTTKVDKPGAVMHSGPDCFEKYMTYLCLNILS